MASEDASEGREEEIVALLVCVVEWFLYLEWIRVFIGSDALFLIFL